MEFSRQISETKWSEFETAYGSADTVGKQLARLASPVPKVAMKASHDLWCGLCHQNDFISSAAWPAFPFLVEAFQQADEKLKVELLDIFLGFSGCLNRSTARKHWETELLKGLKMQSHLFKQAQTSENESISGFASEILVNLDTCN